MKRFHDVDILLQNTSFYLFPLPCKEMIQAAPALTNESRAVEFLCRRRLQTSLHTPYRRRSRNCTARSMFVKALRSSADLYWFAAAPPSFASLVKASPHLSFPAHGAPTPFPVNINAPFLADNSIVSELDFSRISASRQTGRHIRCTRLFKSVTYY